jgi:asparagine synthase (glutamine-hydrolysing)
MCGITGYYGINQQCLFEDELTDSVRFLKHRGPDAHGQLITAKAGLGHTRLSIIDLSENASQPMLSEDGNFILVFNGEIYNYIDLKDRLKRKGAQFNSSSDTEVILRGFELLGDGIFELLQGMFAIAVYNKKDHQLTLARDRFGIKPLYYYKGDEQVFFASELGALLTFPIPRKLDKNVLSQYFRFNYIPGNDAIIDGVKQVKPGNYIFFDKNGVKEHAYYQIRKSNIKIDYNEAIEHIHTLLDQSVEERLIADVPVASFLSGGLDSSIVSLLASKHHPGIETYTAGFSENPYFDESNFGKIMASKINTKHHVFDLSENKIVDAVEDILAQFSEPFADTSAIAYNLLAKETSKQVKVVLSGDGADEVFGGYRKHKAEWLMQHGKYLAKLSGLLSDLGSEKLGSRNNLLGNKKRQLKKWINGANLSNEERYLAWASIQTEDEVSRLLNFNTILTPPHHLKIDNINDVLDADMKMVLPGDMLTKADRMSMQYGLEVRTPFLDHYLVDFVFSLPAKWKLKRGVRKSLLKNAFENDLPKNIVNRKKKGFEVPIWAWLNGPLKGIMLSLLSDEQLNKSGLFNKQEVQKLIDQTFSNQPGDAPITVWALMVFQVWFNKYKPKV